MSGTLWTFGPIPVELPTDAKVAIDPVDCPGRSFISVTSAGAPYWWGWFNGDEVTDDLRDLAGLRLLIPRKPE